MAGTGQWASGPVSGARGQGQGQSRWYVDSMYKLTHLPIGFGSFQSKTESNKDWTIAYCSRNTHSFYM